MILIDPQKAFEAINYKILIQKIEYLGFSKDVILCFKSYISNRKFKVNLNKFKQTFMWNSSRIYFRDTSLSPLHK